MSEESNAWLDEHMSKCQDFLNSIWFKARKQRLPGVSETMVWKYKLKLEPNCCDMETKRKTIAVQRNPSSDGWKSLEWKLYNVLLQDLEIKNIQVGLNINTVDTDINTTQFLTFPKTCCHA